MGKTTIALHVISEYLSKGKQVYIEGRLRTRSWEKDGITRYTTEVEANTMQMLGARDASGSYQGQGNNMNAGSRPNAGGSQNNNMNPGNRQQSDMANEGGGHMGQPSPPPPEDDIPF